MKIDKRNNPRIYANSVSIDEDNSIVQKEFLLTVSSEK